MEELDNKIVFNDEEEFASFFKEKVEFWKEKSFISKEIKNSNYKLINLFLYELEKDIEINFEFNFYNILTNHLNYKYNFYLDIDYNIFFNKISFKENVIFDGISFNNKLHFFNVFFKKNIIFCNSIFNDLELRNCYFYRDLYFSDILIEDKIDVSTNSNFNKELENKKTKFNLKFDYITFNKNSSYINIERIKENSNLSITNTIISGKVNIIDIHLNYFNLDNSIINEGYINTLNIEIDNLKSRRTALLLKQEAYKSHNKIDALKYYSEEIKLHKLEIKENLKNIYKDYSIKFYKKFYEIIKNLGDLFSIYMSSLFSDNGQNWIKALICTLSSTFLIFFIFYIDFNLKETTFEYFLEGFFNYLIPTNYDIFYDYISTNNNIKAYIKFFGAFVYFLGKISFGYGFYNIVISFRKFNKNS